MKTLKFNKEEGKWYVDLPDWTGPKSALQMVAGADTLLDKLSEGKDSVVVMVSEAPVEGESWEKLTWLMDTPFVGGAAYISKYFPVWLCDVLKFVYDGRFPKVLYYQVAPKNES